MAQGFAITGLGWLGSQGLGRGRDESSPAFSPGFSGPVDLKAVIEGGEGRRGRLDEFSKLGLASIALALRDAGLEKFEAKRRVGIVAHSVYGCLSTDDAYWRTVLEGEGKFASPNLFAYTLPNCFLGEAALKFGLTGPTMVLSADAQGFAHAVETALEMLEFGEAEAVLVGFSDLAPPQCVAPLDGVLVGSAFAVVEPASRVGIQPLRVTTADKFVNDFFNLIYKKPGA